MRIAESKLRRIIRSVIREASLPSTNPKELRNTYRYRELSNIAHNDSEYKSKEPLMRDTYSDLYNTEEQLSDKANDYNDPIFDPFTQEEIDDIEFYTGFCERVVRGINKSCNRHKVKQVSNNHPYASSAEKLGKLKSDCLSLGRDRKSILLTNEFPASEKVKTNLEKEINSILVKQFPQHPDDIKSSSIRIHREIYSKILRSLL